MAVGDAFLSAFLQGTSDKLVSKEVREFATRWKIEIELENLRRMLPKIQVVLNDAEDKQFMKNDAALKMWLDDLKHVAYDAEDLLDEISTEAQRQKLEEESPIHTTLQVNKQIPAYLRIEILPKIKDITERLEKIAKDKDVLGLRESGVEESSSGVKQRQPTSSLVNPSHVYGRDKDKEKIIDYLLLVPSSNEVPSVISIVGMGGLGKTTLAQFVYNDDKVKDHFDIKAWVFVSDEFDVLRLTKAILESVSGKPNDLKELDPLQVELMEILRGNKFLFVLDDVWNENYNNWDLLRTPFTFGAQGSKIIVTTQSQKVALIMGTMHTHHLELLSKEDCWSLFTKHAFANRNPNEHPNLVVIGEKIVDKCKGLPLAAKSLGGLLLSKLDADEWEDILNSEMWELQCDIIPSLRLSYHHLPSHLKRCFAYCSIFPKDYEITREELVRLWVAEGFVQQKGRKQMEDMAREYFDDLCLRSFFKQSHRDESPLFIMHDLVNDLAQSISGEICFILDGEMSCAISEKARHSSYLCGSRYDDSITNFEAFYEATSLRTFHQPSTRFETRFYYFTTQFQHDLFSTLRCLRVLSLNDSISKLSDSINNLKHLRYLDLCHTLIEKLPESITTLYNLQTLLLIGCYHLTELPKDMGNLINLRHLDTSVCNKLKKFPPRIGRLRSLQTLPSFVVGENSSPRSGIAELRHMLHLKGNLSISNLKNVDYFWDTMESNLKDNHLSSLQLNWNYWYNDKHFDDSRDEKIDEDVLDRLQPNSGLKELTVSFYNGLRFPSWMGDPSFSNLGIVSLTNCRKFNILPSLGQLPALKELHIEENQGVKSLGCELYGDGLSVNKQFRSLEILAFENMFEWEEWSRVEQGEEEFPRLRELTIRRCPKLRKFSHCFPALVKLLIKDCEELSTLPKHLSSLENLEFDEVGKEFPWLLELQIWNCPRLRELPHLLPSLVELQIFNCHGLAALPRLPSIKKLDLKQCDKMILTKVSELTSLSTLRICSIPNLNILPEGSLQNLTALEELRISDCPELAVLQNDIGIQHLASLWYLEISYCPRLLSLFPGLHHLTCLVELKIHYTTRLTSFSETGFQSGQQLQRLSIVECEKLESLPKGLHNLMYLQELEIKACPALISFPEMEFPPLLRQLQIVKCENLLYLPEQLPQNKSLEYLKIKGCSFLTSFPSGGLTGFPTSLKHIEIRDCRNLESLPEGLHNLTNLQYLRIDGCDHLLSFPGGGFPTKLQSLSIKECLVPLSSWELHKLTSLKDLSISGYPGLVSFPEGLLPTSLTSLSIKRCQNFNSLPKGLHNLTSLQLIECPGLVSFPEWLLPTTLTSLCIEKCQNLKSLPERLHNLTSLEELQIKECKKLESLPEVKLSHPIHMHAYKHGLPRVM